MGRLVAVARGEQEYFDPNGVPTAVEACKSNALMRCCKDLGVASELWYVRYFRVLAQTKHSRSVLAGTRDLFGSSRQNTVWRSLQSTL